MSETQQGSSDIGRVRASKPDKTRRSWTPREEEMLLASLKELVAQGWKADNGFRAGYLLKLEESMRKEFVGTDIKGMPHINSKLSAWKKSYNSLLMALNVSGVGFNAKGTFMLDCDNDQWETIVKKDSNATKMRFKSWPMFEDWKEVFGKDRANGSNAEDVMEAMHKMYAADSLGEVGGNLGQQTGDGLQHHVNEDGEATEDAEDSVCQGEKKVSTARKVSKKRKTGEGEEMNGVYKWLGEISRDTKERLDNLATRVGYEFDLGMARQTVYEQLGLIPGLDMNDKFDICEILADKVQRLEIFIGLPAEAKIQYVARLLQAHRNESRFP
ncbi:uncharacterized protein At2g29880-like isoform X2 [Salvia miltiorrhiza]|uniref:uncharacterized protein At2g29880-like isoform X2 n=1 Tax=Salvia miltiorrhiza TaxID=226208 RepID=UPI0025ACABAC|nr:uncharacterized protein At2g29880-like isoform X2 [Salvia miltiorrhiza]XP_057770151.1 uncharacterized protein At2g29880-like isoform X2 [Salvia miltiorrhiza]XP_057786132.1 uncharacterized protein At2g29880-like isoform X2 [Salvia miltiorrhiza]XP_057795104.1 uncharacterized protein At2g29880-like isoform X2 [Salvia miltiorrhiza]